MNETNNVHLTPPSIRVEDYDRKARQSAAFYRLRPITKLLRRPFRMGATAALSRLLTRFHASFEVPANTFWGAKMSVVLPEPVSTLIHRYGIYEEKVTLFLIKHLRPDDVFLDVGAHLGYFSLLGSELVGLAGQVHSFEPGLDASGYLARNTHGRSNVFRNSTAVYSHSTHLQFRDFGIALSSFNSLFSPRVKASIKPTAYTVKAITIDDYCRDRNLVPRLIKIDAESAEIAILDGMHETLTRARPLLSIEVGDLGVEVVLSSSELVRKVESYGYSAFEFTNGKFVEHVHQNSYSYDNLFFCPNAR